MSKFESPYQEAILGLMVSASQLRANMDRTLASAGLTGEQYNILRILRGATECGHPCGEIGERMMDRASDVTRRIDALEKQGLVSRERSTDDRRVVKVRITEQGISVLDSIAPKIHLFEEELRSKLSEDEVRSLSNICEKIIEVS